MSKSNTKKTKNTKGAKGTNNTKGAKGAKGAKDIKSAKGRDHRRARFAGVDLRVHLMGKACLAATAMSWNRADTQGRPCEKRVFLWMWVMHSPSGGRRARLRGKPGAQRVSGTPRWRRQGSCADGGYTLTRSRGRRMLASQAELRNPTCVKRVWVYPVRCAVPVEAGAEFLRSSCRPGEYSL